MIMQSDSLISSTCQLNNKTISYTDAGMGEALILIHAFPTDKHLWELQTEGLKDSFRIITLDLWGFGQSSAVDGRAVSMDDYAAEVKELLDYLQIQKAIIGGESMGGYIALAFLERYPDSVSGLVLSNTQAIADRDEVKKKREATAIEILVNGTAQFIDGFIVKALSPQASDTTQKFLLGILESQTPTAFASALRGMALRPDRSELVAKAQVPILIITSEKDELVSPQQSQRMLELAKNSTLVSIANAAHLSNLEKADQWNRAVIDFFLKNKPEL